MAFLLVALLAAAGVAEANVPSVRRSQVEVGVHGEVHAHEADVSLLEETQFPQQMVDASQPDGKRCKGKPDVGSGGWLRGKRVETGGWGGLGKGFGEGPAADSACKAACLADEKCKWATLKRGKCSGFSHCSDFSKTQLGFKMWKKIPAPQVASNRISAPKAASSSSQQEQEEVEDEVEEEEDADEVEEEEEEDAVEEEDEVEEDSACTLTVSSAPGEGRCFHYTPVDPPPFVEGDVVEVKNTRDQRQGLLAKKRGCWTWAEDDPPQVSWRKDDVIEIVGVMVGGDYVMPEFCQAAEEATTTTTTTTTTTSGQCLGNDSRCFGKAKSACDALSAEGTDCVWSAWTADEAGGQCRGNDSRCRGTRKSACDALSAEGADCMWTADE